MAQAVEPIAEGPGGGRPNGEPRQQGEFEPLAVTAERVQSAERSKEAAVYPGRFLLGYLTIVLFFGAVIVAAGVVWSHESSGSDSADTNWSFFRPTADSEAQRTREIARFVGTRYQTNRGRQLVRVLGGPPAVQDAPVVQFMVRDAVGGTPEETIGANKAIMFILCGTGTDCTLPAANSSDADLRLVRREALELALYMMKYNDVDPVVVLLPPGPAGDPGGALLFRRKDLESHLDEPLARTLATDKPPTATGITDLEAATVDYLTLTRKFAYTFQSLQGGVARMVLNPDRPS